MADGWRAGSRLAGHLLRQTLVEPLAEGRIGVRTLHPALRAVTIPVLIIFGSCLLMIGASRQLRTRLPLYNSEVGLSYPSGTPILVAFVMVLALVLLFCGAVHMHWSLGLTAWAFLALALQLASVPFLYLSPWFAIFPGFWSAGLLLLWLLRRRRPFVLAELVVSLGLVCTSMAIGWVLWGRIVPDGAMNLVTALPKYLSFFAAPMACQAGVALAEIATSVASGSVRVVRREWPGLRWWMPLLVIIPLAIGSQLLAPPSLAELPAALGLVVVSAGIWIGLGWLGRRRSGRDQPPTDPQDLWEDFRPATWVICVVVTLPAMASGVAAVLTPVLGADQGVSDLMSRTGTYVAGAVGQGLVSGGLVVGLGIVALRLHRSGSVMAARLMALAAVVQGWRLWALVDPDRIRWSADALIACLIGLSVVVAVTALVARRLTPRLALGLTAILVVALAYRLREVLADPLAVLLGSSLVAVLVISSAWQLLTEGGFTRGSSRHFPRSARLLVFLGLQLFWILIATTTALTRDPAFGVVLDHLELGDEALGTVLLLVSVLVMLRRGAAGRDSAGRIRAGGPGSDGGGKPGVLPATRLAGR